MYSKITNLIELSQPIRFITALPITECAKRLQEGIGKPMGCMFERIEGKVEKVEAAQYQFLLYQDDGRTRVSLSGSLHAETQSSTLVTALFVRKSRSLVLVTLMIGSLIIATIISPPARSGLFLALIAGLILLVIWVYRFRTAGQFTSQSNSQLVWWFERTLKQ